jgi:hypothetical protein
VVDEIARIDDVIADVATTSGTRTSGPRSARATRRSLEATWRQAPALDDWQRRVALDLRLLDL